MKKILTLLVLMSFALTSIGYASQSCGLSTHDETSTSGYFFGSNYNVHTEQVPDGSCDLIARDISVRECVGQAIIGRYRCYQVTRYSDSGWYHSGNGTSCYACM